MPYQKSSRPYGPMSTGVRAKPLPTSSKAPTAPPRPLLPLLTAPPGSGGGIDLIPGNCAGCGVETTWHMGQIMACAKCQTIYAYRVSKGMSGHAHQDDYLRFNCGSCPGNGDPCPVAFPQSFFGLHSFHGNNTQVRLCYNRAYRLARGWAVPEKGECKCNGCWPGSH